MALSKGDHVKVIRVTPAMVAYSDWLNSRSPERGDLAIVEEIAATPNGNIIRLVCEPKPGYLDWRIDIYEKGLVVEVLTSA